MRKCMLGLDVEVSGICRKCVASVMAENGRRDVNLTY